MSVGGAGVSWALTPSGLSYPSGVTLNLEGGQVNQANEMLSGEENGLALSFVDDYFLSSTGHYGSARVKDTSTPANNYDSHPFGLLTYAGASKKWVRGPSGLLIESDPALTLPYEWDENGDLLGIRVEEQRTNLFLNNREPVTQNITVTAQAYTLSFYGTGSITLSGAYSDTLEGTGEDERVTLTFTPEEGTLTCTVDGDIDFVQLEAGAFATSPIETAGSTVTRAADTITLATSKFPLSETEGTIYARYMRAGAPLSGMGRSVLYLWDSDGMNNRIGFQTNAAGDAQEHRVVAGGTAANPSNISVDAFKSTKGAVAYAVGTNQCAAVANGGSVTTSSPSMLPEGLTRLHLGHGGGGLPLNGWISEVMYVPRRMTDNELQTLTGA